AGQQEFLDTGRKGRIPAEVRKQRVRRRGTTGLGNPIRWAKRPALPVAVTTPGLQREPRTRDHRSEVGDPLHLESRWGKEGDEEGYARRRATVFGFHFGFQSSITQRHLPAPTERRKYPPLATRSLTPCFSSS